MQNNKFFFLAGLPRSGSTLLGSLLNQNPNIYCSPTSPLYSLLVNTNEHLNLLNLQYTYDNSINDKIYKGIIEAFYPEIRLKPIVIDKHRGWTKNIEAIKTYIDPNPKIICPVRSIAEILTSYITLANKDSDNFIDKHLKSLNQPITDEARAFLLWTKYLNIPYESMKIGLENNSQNILLINYDEIVLNPNKTLDKIYNFCEIDYFKHSFEGIQNTCAEAKDEAWGLKDLHTIRGNLEKKSANPLTVLPQTAIDYFNQFDIK